MKFRPIVYDDEFGPREYADFQGIEERGDLADLELEDCDICGGDVDIAGGFGRDILYRCRHCQRRVLLKHESDEDDEDEWGDDEDA